MCYLIVNPTLILYLDVQKDYLVYTVLVCFADKFESNAKCGTLLQKESMALSHSKHIILLEIFCPLDDVSWYLNV